MPSKRDTQIQREREMRARLGEWLDVAADMAAECDLNLRSREAAADIARSAAA